MNSMDRYIKRMYNMFVNFSAVNMPQIKIKKWGRLKITHYWKLCDIQYPNSTSSYKEGMCLWRTDKINVNKVKMASQRSSCRDPGVRQWLNSALSP